MVKYWHTFRLFRHSWSADSLIRIGLGYQPRRTHDCAVEDCQARSPELDIYVDVDRERPVFSFTYREQMEDRPTKVMLSQLLNLSPGQLAQRVSRGWHDSTGQRPASALADMEFVFGEMQLLVNDSAFPNPKQAILYELAVIPNSLDDTLWPGSLATSVSAPTISETLAEYVSRQYDHMILYGDGRSPKPVRAVDIAAELSEARFRVRMPWHIGSLFGSWEKKTDRA